MTEPRFFGDVHPPDDPRPGDEWLANGVWRVRLDDCWYPAFEGETARAVVDASYAFMLTTTRRRAGLKARATRERRKAEIPVGQ
jgi:hypothetical protein